MKILAKDSVDVADHIHSRCFIPYLHEYATTTKCMALLPEFDLLTKMDAMDMCSDHANDILPTGDECQRCGKPVDTGVHRLVCFHPWWNAIEKMKTDVKLPADVTALVVRRW